MNNERYVSSTTKLQAAVTVSFHSCVEQLQTNLVQREQIVARIELLLNCQKKPLDYQQDQKLLAQLFKECFLPLTSTAQALPCELLEQVHWASGFTPRATPGNALVDPVQQLLRALHCWRQTRWPGTKGRVRYAHTLFNLHVIRCLALMTMRLWDEAANAVSTRLAQLQHLLDQLWSNSPSDQPRLVLDVRWLIPVALSPTTDELHGYFAVTAKIADTFTEADRIETHKAWVQTGAGHLRAQLRHLAVQDGVGLDDNNLMLLTRRSNALDVALLLQGLVTLLNAYEHCIQNGDTEQRLALASAIFQGLSPDPELFLNQLELLGPYTMIELLFITTDDTGQAVYTAAGLRHLQLCQHYKALITRLAPHLQVDYPLTALDSSVYSPFGVLYGFASNLIELMALKTLQVDADVRFSMEAVFTTGTLDKRTWVNSWRRLPHIKPEVVKQFDYPQQFAEDISKRIEQALQSLVAACAGPAATGNCGRLFILPEESSTTNKESSTINKKSSTKAVNLAQLPELPARFILSSDPHLIAAHTATAKDQEDLLHCRLEGEFLVSYATANGWVAINKDLLAEVLGTGTSVKLSGLPPAAASMLQLMCPNLVLLAD